MLKQKMLDEASLLVSKSNQYLDLYTESVRSLFLYLQSDTITASGQLLALADISPLIIETLYFVADDGSVLSSRQVEYDVMGNDFSQADVDLGAVGSVLVWSEPYYSPLSGTTVAFLQRNDRGVMILEADLDVLGEKIVGLVDRRGITLHVTSARDATILYDWNGPFRFPVSEDEMLRRALSTVPKGVSTFVWKGAVYDLIKSRANSLGWTVYAILDPAFFSEGLGVLSRGFATLALLLFALLLLSSVVLSLIITKPMRRLALAMDQVRSLKHLTPIANTYQDELKSLVDAYNSMMGRIISLTREKNEYEWKMLQSQIGPHFLYNTLACIHSLAKRGRIAEITHAVGSLIHLLRYSFDRTSCDVALDDELRVLDSYVAIENIRYGDLFALDVRVPADLRRLRVPALLLQPVVENSIFHGFSGGDGKGRISVSAARDGSRLVITVEDDGRGIPPDKLDRLRRRLKENDGSDNDVEATTVVGSGDRMNAIGLRNIERRLRVHYGEEYGLRIESRPGVGTQVSLVLPVVTG